MKAEKMIVLFVIGTFTIISISSFNAFGNPLTKEEAVEISKNSGLVKEALATTPKSISIEANFYNSSMVEQLEKGPARDVFERVPDAHSVWEIIWYFSWGVGGHPVIVIVDAEIGTLIYDLTGAYDA